MKNTDFDSALDQLVTISPPMQDSLRAHPEWLDWLREHDKTAWEANTLEELRAFKRREYLDIAYRDIAGVAPFEETVGRLSALADRVIETTVRRCRHLLLEEISGTRSIPDQPEEFGVIAMGKLGGNELNYSSDIDLIFCRRDSDNSDELRFFTRLGERVIQALSKPGAEGFLYRVDMRLRPYGETGPLVPTISSLIGYYESWGEAWERQALIKARFVAGPEGLRRRFTEFLADFTFARQMDDSALEEIKRIKFRSEREYALDGGKIHLKQGPGGIRDIEFYVQYLQLIAGWDHPEARSGSTLQAIRGLSNARVLLEGEESQLSLAYLFLRSAEHHLQLKALAPLAVVPTERSELESFARGLGFDDVETFLEVLGGYRTRVRTILERIYLTPGYLRLKEREEEFGHLLSERTPKERVRELLGQYGFQDIDKAWQNIRLMALGPAGRLLPPGERRAFLECVFPLLEALRDSIDPDRALHNLESFAAATGNRVSFLRALASRKPHLVRLSNLLALSNLCHQILSRHPEYFDTLARGIHLHEGRTWSEMHADLSDRIGASPRGEARDLVLRRFRKREMIRVAYRDLAGLAKELEISRELSDLAEACVRSVVNWTRPPGEDPLHVVALGKFGSRQMHYASDLDLMVIYDAPVADAPAEERARVQQEQDDRVERVLELVGGVTTEGVAYPVDFRLRPEGASGLLARSWESFLEYARQYMQPWERMALVRSRILADGAVAARWQQVLAEVVYEYPWNDESLEGIRHIKRRIENEKNKESRTYLDFKYGKGGIADLEFLVQFLQILNGRTDESVRAPSVADALPALCRAGALTDGECKAILEAHHFQRRVENRLQLMEEWALREVSRESPLLMRLARSLGQDRRAFLDDWQSHVATIRPLFEKYFFG